MFFKFKLIVSLLNLSTHRIGKFLLVFLKQYLEYKLHFLR